MLGTGFDGSVCRLAARLITPIPGLGGPFDYLTSLHFGGIWLGVPARYDSSAGPIFALDGWSFWPERFPYGHEVFPDDPL